MTMTKRRDDEWVRRAPFRGIHVNSSASGRQRAKATLRPVGTRPRRRWHPTGHSGASRGHSRSLSTVEALTGYADDRHSHPGRRCMRPLRGADCPAPEDDVENGSAGRRPRVDVHDHGEGRPLRVFARSFVANVGAIVIAALIYVILAALIFKRDSGPSGPGDVCCPATRTPATLGLRSLCTRSAMRRGSRPSSSCSWRSCNPPHSPISTTTEPVRQGGRSPSAASSPSRSGTL